MKILSFVILFVASVVFAGEGLVKPAMQWSFEADTPELINAIAADGTGAGCRVVDGRTAGSKALAFQGTGKDRGNVGSACVRNVKFDFAKPFSAEILLKLNADAGYRDFKDIIGCCDGERGPGFRLSIFYNKVILRSGDRNTAVDIASNPALSGLKPNTWHLVAITCDGKNGIIYIDGVEVAKNAFVVTPCKSKNLVFGSFRAGYAYPLQGAIDYVRLYDRALEPEEIAELYLNEFGE